MVAQTDCTPHQGRLLSPGIAPGIRSAQHVSTRRRTMVDLVHPGSGLYKAHSTFSFSARCKPRPNQLSPGSQPQLSFADLAKQRRRVTGPLLIGGLGAL